MLLAYRSLYGISAALMLANLLVTNYYGAIPRSTTWLVLAAKLSLFCLLAVTIGFPRVKPGVVWAIILSWEALFVWYAWFSLGAPFALYKETHGVVAIGLFTGLFLWFMVLGVVRSCTAGTAQDEAGDRVPSHS